MTTDDDLSPADGHLSTAPTIERSLVVITALAVAVGTVLRFLPRSALWLDEALTVNISTLPIGQIGDALRSDGHPPLFYYLLNVWTSIGGSSDWWVRALAGAISLISFPLAYLGGRRIAERVGAGPLGSRRTGMIALAVAAMLPYGIRYGAETRMYSLTITLVFAGYLLVDDLLSARSVGRRRALVALGAALVAAAMLWSHYWSMWLLATVGAIAVVQSWRARSAETRTGARMLVASLLAGGVLFLPWVPTLLFQNSHTGTPWGKRFGPVEVATTTIVDFSGDALASYVTLFFVVIAVVAVVAMVAPGARGQLREVVALSWSIQPRVRLEIGVLLATIGIGWATAAVSGNTYSSRYAAVVFPLFALSVAAGIAVLRGPRATVGALAALLVLSTYAATSMAVEDRTQAGAVAEQIVAAVSESPGGTVVVACPDQIGVALQRVLDQRGSGLEVVPYPDKGDPRFVDWVDYAERNAAADPEEFFDSLDLDPRSTLHVVAMPGYRTFESQCERLVQIASERRPALSVVEPDTAGEVMGLWSFGPAQ